MSGSQSRWLYKGLTIASCEGLIDHNFAMMYHNLFGDNCHRLIRIPAQELGRTTASWTPTTATHSDAADQDQGSTQLGYTRPGPTFKFAKQVEGNEPGTAVKLEVSS